MHITGKYEHCVTLYNGNLPDLETKSDMHENLMLSDSLNELSIAAQLKQRKQAMISVALYELPMEMEIDTFW